MGRAPTSMTLPTAGPDPPQPPRQPATRHPDDELANGANHEQQPERIADKPRDANQYPADQDDQSVEQLPSGRFSPHQPLASVNEHADADVPDHKGSECTHDEQERQRPEEADLLGDDDKCRDLCGDDDQHADEEHNAG